MIGFGNPQAPLQIYIANRPPLDFYQQLEHLHGLDGTEIKAIADATGNHWRKVFNVFAKLMFALDDCGEPSWQVYRDNRLLRSDGNELLLFDAPDFSRSGVHIITGKQYADQLGLLQGLAEVSPGFYLDSARRLIVCPYLDYRQLSNAKLEVLQELVQAL